mmetsp:Transcript_289/g.523  ORF Transcript_289/g.523 Transcript_289/m.523 type:complete len:209 (-) Transcript_289:1105-1731(-)
MVGGLIQQEHIGLQQHGSGKRELHAPPTREGSYARLDGCCRARHAETHVREHGAHSLLGHVLLLHLGVGHDVVEHSHVGLLANDLALDVHGDKLGGETSQISSSNGLHQCGLSSTICTNKSVLASNLHLERCLVQEHASPVRKREGGVTEIFFFVLWVHFLGRERGCALSSHFLQHLRGGLRRGGHDGLEVRQQALLPLLRGTVVALH